MFAIFDSLDIFIKIILLPWYPYITVLQTFKNDCCGYIGDHWINLIEFCNYCDIVCESGPSLLDRLLLLAIPTNIRLAQKVMYVRNIRACGSGSDEGKESRMFNRYFRRILVQSQWCRTITTSLTCLRPSSLAPLRWRRQHWTFKKVLHIANWY
jgi:hypothetical protein